MKKHAVLLCSGVGSRMKSSIPKQYLTLNNREIWTYGTETFLSSHEVDSLTIVASEQYVHHIEKNLKKIPNSQKCSVVIGGKERFDSAYNAFCSIKDTDSKILFFDAARPFISKSLIKKCFDALDVYPCVDVGIPVRDTVFVVEDNIIKKVPNRKTLFLGQGPECFHLSLLRKAFEQFQKTPFPSTNISGIVQKFFPQTKLGFVLGEIHNFKITYPFDLACAEAFLNSGDFNEH
ncbi:IspD/TarI family cytidylyltransferase [Desulfobaculum bizertense]|uniref:2-C-methyl-D-erythritol 4-phosphate cytidylyltransferase n=1 Tax=Desulfobaculum bizertense DSM 18034 TaxID=1121442 RepID=A0A1T4VYV8_9BACT|nr:IspD/TarI family cytidylyltransferase [Desulfobaculum bizertense]SKA70212.1 2-C-methyl-D-erythritol 4-phosphate cytidylyltransferase [Desulfobaculum bizertense DSM 18034]